jgi:hypothetical protein
MKIRSNFMWRLLLGFFLLLPGCFSASAQQGNVAISGSCNVSVINTGTGTQKVELEAGICSDKVDPSKALRIRYLWLDSVSASLLFVGKISGNLAKATGQSPYLLKNKVYDEIALLIDRFGSNLAEPGVNGSVVSSSLEGMKGSSEASQQDMMSFRKQLGSRPKIYNAEENVTFPDVDAFLTIQNTDSFPSNYSMFYQGYTALSTVDDLLARVTLWRPIAGTDLSEYTRNVERLRDLVLAHKFRMDVGTWKQTPTQTPKPVQVPKTIAALRYFSRSGLPEDFLRVEGSGVQCGGGIGIEFSFSVPAPRLFLLVAVLENVEGKGVLPITSVKAEEIDSDRLRAPADDKNWTPTEFAFPPTALQANESIVIPLSIELRPESSPIWNRNEADQLFSLIRAFQKPIVSKNEKGIVLYRKSKDAFKPPQFPRHKTFAYGPRVRLLSAVSNAREIKLRQFNPAAVAMHFEFQEGSCPGFYVKLPDESTARSYGRVLVGATSNSKARKETIWHEGPAEYIELLEDEPEITRIAKINAFVTDALGNEVLVEQLADQFVLPGRPLRIQNSHFLHAIRIRVEVEGFYQSLPAILMNSRADAIAGFSTPLLSSRPAPH